VRAATSKTLAAWFLRASSIQADLVPADVALPLRVPDDLAEQWLDGGRRFWQARPSRVNPHSGRRGLRQEPLGARSLGGTRSVNLQLCAIGQDEPEPRAVLRERRLGFTLDDQRRDDEGVE
jgi:hypothetical protein